jgi:hypothetical protein
VNNFPSDHPSPTSRVSIITSFVGNREILLPMKHIISAKAHGHDSCEGIYRRLVWNSTLYYMETMDIYDTKLLMIVLILINM